jgi:hypothetical protein
MSYRSKNCAWCGVAFPVKDEIYGPLYNLTDDGYRVCSNMCESAWYDAGSMANVKELMAKASALHAENDRLQAAFVDVNLDADKRIDDAAEVVLDLLRCIDKLSEGKTLEWLRPSIASANVWLSRPKS